MTGDQMARAVEAELVELSGVLTEPAEDECLRCYLLRMISEFGCDGKHRWTTRWLQLRAPALRGLVRKLAGRGVCCDCQVVLNVFPGYPDTRTLLPCSGGQPGSAAPCDLNRLRRTA